MVRSAILFLALILQATAFAYDCGNENRYLLSKLGFSEAVAVRICADERNMKYLRKRAIQDPESAKAFKVYRGLPIDPSAYIFDKDFSVNGIGVASDVYKWPLSKATVWHSKKDLELMQRGEKVLYGTLVEFEFPRFFFKNERFEIESVPEEKIQGGVKSLPIYTSRIGKVDVKRAMAEKYAKSYRTEECLRGLTAFDPANPPLIEWRDTGW